MYAKFIPFFGRPRPGVPPQGPHGGRRQDRQVRLHDDGPQPATAAHRPDDHDVSGGAGGALHGGPLLFRATKTMNFCNSVQPKL